MFRLVVKPKNDEKKKLKKVKKVLDNLGLIMYI